jgi:methyl-accepting chemotaxis protein
MQEKNRKIEQQKETEAVASEMKNNMKLLQRRGEQIDEMGDKARGLNEGAQDFAYMAKQLKEKSMKKKWYQLK